MGKIKNGGGWQRTNITPAAMRQYADAMRKIAGFHERIADLMDESKIESVDARGLKQTLEAYTRISSFLGSVFEAYSEHTVAGGVGELHEAVRYMAELTSRLPRDESPPKFVPDVAAAEVAANEIKRSNAQQKTVQQKGKKKPKVNH